MSKVSRTFRFDQSALDKLDILVTYYQRIADVSAGLHSGVRSKVTRTDVLDLLIKERVEKLVEEGYKV